LDCSRQQLIAQTYYHLTTHSNNNKSNGGCNKVLEHAVGKATNCVFWQKNATSQEDQMLEWLSLLWL
jgi:hypothetical protein